MSQKTSKHSPDGQDRMFIKYAGAVFAVSFLFVCAIYYFGSYFMSGSLRSMNGFADLPENDLGYVLLMGVDLIDDRRYTREDLRRKELRE